MPHGAVCQTERNYTEMIAAVLQQNLMLAVEAKPVDTWVWVVLGVSLLLMVAAVVFLIMVSRAKSKKLEGELEPVLDEEGNLVLDEDGEPMFHHVSTLLAPVLDGNGEPMLDENGDPIYEHDEDQDDGALAAMADYMPWVISGLLHVGIFMIMLFFVFLAGQTEKKKKQTIIPSAEFSETPGGAMTESQSQSQNQSSATAKSPTKSKTSSVNTGKTSTPLDSLMGAVGGASAGGAPSMGTRTSGGGGPQGSFMGMGGNAYNVCYVIDRSGSMIDTFEEVKMEMLRSIARMDRRQKFHIILFAQNKPQEPNFRSAPPAKVNDENKITAAKFLDDVISVGQTDPVPAIRRAFDVLSSRHVVRPGRLVYLLTDGVFPDNKGVLSEIKKLSSRLPEDKKVMICTFLYGNKPPEAEAVMKQIAKDTGGRYKFVQREE